jgi:Na+-translocating ferredoxin:NAD+ oxidoreductase RnfE subunit
MITSRIAPATREIFWQLSAKRGNLVCFLVLSLSLRSPLSTSAALAQTLQSVAVLVLTSRVLAIASLLQVLVRRGAVPPEVTEALVHARCVKLYQIVCTFIPLIFVCNIASGRGAHWLSFSTVPWGIG